MKNAEWQKIEKISYEFYDTIDFKEFIYPEQCVDVRMLMDAIEDYYDHENPDLLPKELQGCFFDVISEGEFCEYLAKRYGWRSYAEVRCYLETT